MWGRGKWCGGAGGNANSIIFIIYYSKNNDFVVKRENKNDDFCIFFYYQRADDSILSLIAELKDPKTVLAAYHTNDPNAGMANSRDLSKFKLFLADTGLFTTLAFKDKDFTENVIYEKLLNDKLSSNLGYLYENIVAQMLAANGNELFYHTFLNEKSRHNYEIDFLLARKNKICPIEVKSSGYKTHASLDAFTVKFSDRILQRYLVYTKDLRKDGDIVCMPVYMAMFL